MGQFPPEHLPVRADSSSRWAAWLRGEASGAVIDGSSVVLAADSDSDDEDERGVIRFRRATISTLEPSESSSSEDGSALSDDARSNSTDREEERTVLVLEPSEEER